MSRTADAFIEIVEHCYPRVFVGQDAMMERIIEKGIWRDSEIKDCARIEDDLLRGFALAQIIHDMGVTDIVSMAFRPTEVRNACCEIVENSETERDNNV